MSGAVFSSSRRTKYATADAKSSWCTIGAYSNSDENTAVATATSDTAGNYTLTVQTGGHPLDGYIKATIIGYLDTYLYPPAPFAVDFNGAALNIITQNTYDLVSNLCQGAQVSTNGGIALEVVDTSGNPIGGATVSSTPAWMVDANTPSMMLSVEMPRVDSNESGVSHSSATTVTLSLCSPPLRNADSTRSGTASDTGWVLR